MKKLNTEITSKINRSIVLAQIYHNPMISRAELATMTGLNRSAITHILNEFLRKGLVEEVKKGKAGARGGRCPIHLQVKFDVGSLVALEVGLQKITGVIADLEGRETARAEMGIEHGEDLIEALARFLERLRSEEPESFQKAVVMGIACPGVVDSLLGRMVVNMYHGWRNVNVALALEDRYGKTVFLENDANAAAMGEFDRLEKTHGVRSFIYLFIRESTPGSPSPLGVGGAVILNGVLWHGANFCAGEASQTINLVFTRIMDDLHRRRGRASESEPRTLGDLVKLAEGGDEACRTALEEIADQLGKFLGEFGAFLDSEGVVVYIHPPEGKKAFLEQIETAFYRNYRSPSDTRVEFLRPELATGATLWGVIRLGQERVFVRDGSHQSILFR